MSLSDVIGHTQIVNLLRQAVARDRVPQSLLLAGPDGVGKRTTAMALAAEVVAQPGGKPAKAPKGPASTAVPFDVVVIDRGDDATIKIKTLRERVLATVGYRPFVGRKRVYIIDGADDLTWEAQDALLKTLEEPPPSAILMLVTSVPDTLLPTIQSRCRRLRFGPLSDADVTRVLVERCRVAPAQARLLAAAAGGSVGRALAEEAGDIADDRDAAMDLLAAAAGRGVLPKLKAATSIATNKTNRRDREALSTRLSIAASLLRDVAATAAHPSTPLANPDLSGPLADLARTFSSERAAAGFSAIDHALNALDRNASPKIVADWVALTL